MVFIIKASNEKEKFDKKKIENTLLKTGVSKNFAKEISREVEKKIYEGIKSKEVLKITLDLLIGKPEIASRYNLKQSILSLGPSGFPFEEFFSQILKSYGYDTKVDQILNGKNITQEVDIIATKEKIYMVECKYHNSKGIKTRSKVSMYTYARFLDVKENSGKTFNFPWLVTNTKCSLGAINYAQGVDMKITSWQYPKKENLQELILKKSLYPITILPSVKGFVKTRLLDSKVMLAKTLTEKSLDELKKITRLSKKILNKLKEEAGRICWGCEKEL